MATHHTRKHRTRKHRTRRSSAGGNGKPLNPTAPSFKPALRATAPAFVPARSKLNRVMNASSQYATNALRPYNGKNISRRANFASVPQLP